MSQQFNLKDFEEICKNLVWKWELIEDEDQRKIEEEKFKSMMAYYQSLRFSLVDESDTSRIDVRKVKEIESVYRKYAPDGYMP